MTTSSIAPLASERPRLVELLFAPSEHVVDAVERRRARLLAAVTLVLSFYSAQGILTLPAVAPPGADWILPRAMTVITLAHLLAYALARSRAFALGIQLSIAVQMATPQVISLLMGAKANPMSCAGWTSLSILIASALVTPRSLVAVGATGIAANLVTLGALGKTEALGEAVTFLIGVTAVVYVYARHRDAVESIRQRQLRVRNDALEQLRTTLEERVAERTRALEQKRVELAEAYDALQANQTALLQTEKMAAIGRLTAGFAHELASPLAAVLASADELSVLRDELARSIGDSSVTPDDLREIAGEMKEPIELTTLAATRAANFVRGIRAHTRISGPRDRQRFDAGGVVREALALIAHAARSGRVRVAFQPPAAAVELHGVPGRLSQAVINVVSNAIDAVGDAGGGKVEVELVALGSEVVIEVRDDGPGIAHADLGRIFEPLFTTKPQGKGTGLGLAIVREIVHDEFCGRVEVESAPGEGARFVLRLPKPEAA